MGIKIFNSLPQSMKEVSSNARKFEICLKKFLLKILFNTEKNIFIINPVLSNNVPQIALIGKFAVFHSHDFSFYVLNYSLVNCSQDHKSLKYFTWVSCLTPTMYISISADMFCILLIALTSGFMERE